MKTPLACRVEATNKANKYAHRLYALLTPIFDKISSDKVIVKNNGELLAKYAKLLPKFPEVAGITVYKRLSSYSVVWVVKACVTENEHSYYYEVPVTICFLTVTGRVETIPTFTARTDYNEEEIVAARRKFNELCAAVREVEAKLFHFGQYD